MSVQFFRAFSAEESTKDNSTKRLLRLGLLSNDHLDPRLQPSISPGSGSARLCDIQEHGIPQSRCGNPRQTSISGQPRVDTILHREFSSPGVQQLRLMRSPTPSTSCTFVEASEHATTPEDMGPYSRPNVKDERLLQGVSQLTHMQAGRPALTQSQRLATDPETSFGACLPSLRFKCPRSSANGFRHAAALMMCSAIKSKAFPLLGDRRIRPQFRRRALSEWRRQVDMQALWYACANPSLSDNHQGIIAMRRGFL